MPGPARQPTPGFRSVTTKRTGVTHSLGNIYLQVRGTPTMRLARTMDNSAWAPGFYQAIYRANLRIAREVQKRAAENLDRTLVRPGQSTGKLKAAILDPGAVYADGSKIIIGVGEVLDKEAPYWRAVEEGMAPLPFTAFGFWTTAVRGEGGPLEPPIGGLRTGRPIIVGFGENPDNGRFYTWKFTRGIEAHRYFSDAWDSVRDGFVEAAYTEEFAKVIGPSGRPLRFPRGLSTGF